MPTIVYRLCDGTERLIDASEGTTVMNAAIQNDIEGIVAECGGSCSCATCHVYVDERFTDRLPPISGSEDELLSVVAAERRPNSRLSCQIPISASLDGLVVTIPETQCF
jgi:2Fe-2S ferredoxin